MNGGEVRWRSSKKSVVAGSSTSVEYVAALEAVQGAVWMKEFISELGVVLSVLDLMVIYCDKNGAISNAKEPRSHKNSKHIKHRFHSIREHVKDAYIKIWKVLTDLNVADPLTKSLPKSKHNQH
jgi:hypothetical protein